MLNSSLNDQALRSRCLHGLQKVSARCGLLPKSYWIPLSDLAEPDGASLVEGRVSSTHQRLIDGKIVAVKTINPDCIENLNAYKHVRLSPSPKRLLSTPFSVWVIAEPMHQCGHVETTTTSKRGWFLWVRLRLPSFFPRVCLDAQR